MNRKKQVFWTLLIIFYVGFIFRNSLTPAEESSMQSGRVLAMILTVFRAVGLRGISVTEHLVRKLAHFTEFALLGVLLWNGLRTYMLPRKLWLMVQLWLITVIPLMDETFQLFTEGRAGMISDVWLDISGAVFGSLCMLGIWHLAGKYGGRKRTRSLEKRRKV